jgi:hypothetical protein
MTKEQLKNIALKQRIGEITSRYEDELADLRAGFTQQLGALQDAFREQEITIENLQEQLRKSNVNLQDEETTEDSH